MKTSLVLSSLVLVAVLVAPTPSRQQATQRASIRTAIPPATLERTRVEPTLAWADFDLDGRSDAFLVSADGVGRLLWNAAGEGLRPAGDTFGLRPTERTLTAAWNDVDADGDPDLLLLFARGAVGLYRNERAAGFADVTELAGLGSIGALAFEWIDVDGANGPDLCVTTASAYRVLVNDGAGVFAAWGETIDAFPVTLNAPGRIATRAEPGAQPSEDEVPVGSANTVSTRAPLAEPRRSSSPSGATPAPIGGASGAEVLPLVPSVFPLCASSLTDQATGACLEASSTPTMGWLYPQSVSLNVSATNGSVGVGTTMPTSQLHVAAKGKTALTANSSADVAALFSSPGRSLHTLRVLSDDGAAGFAGRVNVGTKGPASTIVSRITLDVDGNDGAYATFLGDGGGPGVKIVAKESVNDGAQIELWNTSGVSTIRIDADDAAEHALLELDQADGTSKIVMRATDQTTPGAELQMFTSGATRTVHLVSEEAASNGAQLTLGRADGTTTMLFDADLGATAAVLSMSMNSGQETVQILSEETAGTGGQIVLRKGNGTAGIVLDAEQGAESRITTDTLMITGGADLVEAFELVTGVDAPAGSVLVVSERVPGAVDLSREAYDGRAVGIVSGAGGVRTGLELGQAGVLDGGTKVALTGRVYVRCSTENGVIRAGDLLTTATLAGHAMRATDRDRAFGAVIGKALTGYDGVEPGLVLVLVGLQ